MRVSRLLAPSLIALAAACSRPAGSDSDGDTSEGSGESGSVVERACDASGRCWRVEEVDLPDNFGIDLAHPALLDLEGDGGLLLVAMSGEDVVVFDPMTGVELAAQSTGQLDTLSLNFMQPGVGVWAQAAEGAEPAISLVPFEAGSFGPVLTQAMAAPLKGLGVALSQEPLGGSVMWIEDGGTPELVIAQGFPGALDESARIAIPAGSGFARARAGDFDRDGKADIGLFGYRPGGGTDGDSLLVLDVEGSPTTEPIWEISLERDLWRPSPVDALTRIQTTGLMQFSYEPGGANVFTALLEFPNAPGEQLFNGDAAHGLTPDGTLWVVGREHGLDVQGEFPWTRQPWVQRIGTDNALAFDETLVLRNPCPPADEVSSPTIRAAGAGSLTGPNRDEFLVWERTCEEAGRFWAIVEDE